MEEKIIYEKLGFRCGIECHQQLETHKLFCDCPSLVNDPAKADSLVKRSLRASAGETGDVDVAATFEEAKKKEIEYEACFSSSCIVELDEEPPHDINKEAVDIALEVALLMNMKIVDEIQVMRKVVVDGSNVSAFQRTALVAIDGFIETSKGKVSIPVLFLEEEAAKKLRVTDESVRYRLDRLGVPLLEIATGPDIKGAEHAKEVASIIGMILRSTNKVKRGIGSIRQDVNVSIKGGSRVEIKGFQNLKSMPKVIDYEIKRQMQLIKQGKKIKKEVRKFNADFSTSFLRPMPGASRLYPETDVYPIRITKERIENIELPELLTEKAMILEREHGLNFSLAQEIAGRDIDFLSYVRRYDKIKPELIAQVLIEMPKEIKARFNLDINNIKNDDYDSILKKLNEGNIEREAVLDILTKFAKGEKVDFSSFKKRDISDLEKEIKRIVDENRDASFNAIMGEVMKKFRGKVDGKAVAGLINKLLK